MEFKQYLSIVRRWAWLLILGLGLGTLAGYGFARSQTPVYAASTRVMVSRASMQAASSTGSTADLSYISDQQLIQTYIELLKSSSIFENISRTLGYPVEAEQIVAQQVRDTRILNISVEDTDPRHAADIANAIASALIGQNEELEAGRYAASEQNLQSQIEQTESQIASLQSQIDTISSQNLEDQITQAKTELSKLELEINALKQEIEDLKKVFTADAKTKITEKQLELDGKLAIFDLYQQAYANLIVLGNSVSGSGNDSTSQRLAQVQNTLSLYQEIYINLLQSLETVRFSRLQNTQSINQVQAALIPEFPIRPQPLNTALLAGVVGLMLAAGIIFLIEYLDDTLKAPEDVEGTLGIPLIGYIAEMKSHGKEEAGIYVSKQPRSPVSEAFRSLRTNLEFSAIDKPVRTILVTGAEAGDGKTTIACNLAAIIAQGGKRVLLLDCDLRRPRVHSFLGFKNRVGLTDLFRGNLSVEAVTRQWKDANSKTVFVITTGNLPPNPAELLGSNKMDQILAAISSQVDVVIIDSPPSLVSDAQILAAKVDCVLLVMQPGKTHIGAARATREQLDRAGARIVGAVFNRIPRSRGYYYGGYHYYSPYYSRNDQYLSGGDLNEAPAQPAPAQSAVDEPITQPRSLVDKIFKRHKIPKT